MNTTPRRVTLDLFNDTHSEGNTWRAYVDRKLAGYVVQRGRTYDVYAADTDPRDVHARQGVALNRVAYLSSTEAAKDLVKSFTPA